MIKMHNDSIKTAIVSTVIVQYASLSLNNDHSDTPWAVSLKNLKPFSFSVGIK